MKQLIRKILKEETLKQKLIDEIKENSFNDTVKLTGDVDSLFNLLNIKTPMDFLHLFDDMDVVESEEDPDLILFGYKPNYDLMKYDKKDEFVFIDFVNIWSVLRNHFDLSFPEIEGITELWLGEIYNLREIAPLPLNIRRLNQ